MVEEKIETTEDVVDEVIEEIDGSTEVEEEVENDSVDETVSEDTVEEVIEEVVEETTIELLDAKLIEDYKATQAALAELQVKHQVALKRLEGFLLADGPAVVSDVNAEEIIENEDDKEDNSYESLKGKLF